MADELSDRLSRLEGLLPEFSKRVEEHFGAVERSVASALEAVAVADAKASAALEKRLDNVNEWRQSYDDLARQKVGKDEALTRFLVTLALSAGAILVSIAGIFFRR